jgi:hypothetical protein
MSNRIRFELHAYPPLRGSTGSGRPELDLPAHPDEALASAASVLAIDQDERDEVLVSVDPDTGHLVRTLDPGEAAAALAVVQRRVVKTLAVRPRRRSVRVNGLPALDLTVLALRDSVSLAPGAIAYLSERVTPHVGPPTQELLGVKCPFCRLAFTPETRVVGHRCSDSIAYHWETAESHPHIPAEDRLDCFAKLRDCQSCNRPLVLEEYLAWDPALW